LPNLPARKVPYVDIMKTHWKFYISGAVLGIGLTLLVSSAITLVYVSPALDILIQAQPYLEQLSTLSSQAQELRGFMEQSGVMLENSQSMLEKAFTLLGPIASILPTGDLVDSLQNVRDEVTNAQERIQSMESTFDDDMWPMLDSVLTDMASLGRTALFVKQLLIALSVTGATLVIAAVLSAAYIDRGEGELSFTPSARETRPTLPPALVGGSATRKGTDTGAGFCGHCGTRVSGQESGYCEECGARLAE